jgi:hypothetical protein
MMIGIWLSVDGKSFKNTSHVSQRNEIICFIYNFERSRRRKRIDKPFFSLLSHVIEIEVK